MRFSDTLCIVTGASSGIGLEFARRFASDGASLIITGRRAELLEQRKRELQAQGAPEVLVVSGQLEDQETVGRISAAISESRLPPGALVNNAGFGSDGPLGDTLARSLEMVTVHAEVPMRLMGACLPRMRERGAGLVVNVGSLAGRVAVPDSATYVATKAFLERLSETVALEEYRHGIAVQALTPGYVRTDFHRAVEDLESRRVNRGLIRWLDSDAVVDVSMRAAARAFARIARGAAPVARDVVVVPGWANRLLSSLAPLFPRSVTYRAAENRTKL